MKNEETAMSKFVLNTTLIIAMGAFGAATLSTAAAIDHTLTECDGLTVLSPEAWSGDEAPAALAMDFGTTDLGGSYDYEFELTFTNDDGSWAPGHGYGWLIFGDIMSDTSPLNGWVGDMGDLPQGPWTSYSTSGGYHNGPTMMYVLDYWMPTTVGESLAWSGTHSTNQSELIFSSIVTTGGAPQVNWQPMGGLSTPGPAVEQIGDCPGSVTLDFSNLTPGGKMALVYSTTPGTFTIPAGYGTCDNTTLPVGGTPTLLTMLTADASGNASFTGNTKANMCGVIQICGLDLDTCIPTAGHVLQ
jgi:hypothetical protein